MNKLFSMAAVCLILLSSCQNTSKENTVKSPVISLSLDSSQFKTSYNIGETITNTGLSVKATDEDGSTFLIEEYALLVDGIECSSYLLKEAGEYKVSVSLDNIESEAITVYCYSQDDKLPQQYTDDTIEIEKSKHEATISFTSNLSSSNEKKNVYLPDDIDASFHSYDIGRRGYNKQHFLKSTGNVPLLVIPIVLPGSKDKATENNLSLIKDVFYGNSKDIHYESLHSYYYKSSFGQLNFTFNVTDYFLVEDNTSYHDVSAITSTNDFTSIAKSSLSYFETQGYNYQNYDSDKDGCIDAVWYVFIGKESSDMPFWAYTSFTTEVGTIEKPVLNTFGFVGLDMLTQDYYDKLGLSDGNKGRDAHVVIHETGHMLGLNDYYSYSDTDSYGPMGGIDMMDKSIGDQNSYSKLRLGWVKPTIVTGDCILSIKDIHDPQSVILLTYPTKEYQKDDNGKIIFNPFDEYLLVDLYTDDGLNEQDYKANKAEHIKGTGVRLLHVDARTGYVTNGTYFSYYRNPDDVMKGENVFSPISNTLSGSRSEEAYTNENEAAFDEVRLIDASHGYVGLSKDNHVPDTDVLFKSNDSFSIDSFQSQFVNGRFDNIQKPYISFTVSSLE